MMHQNKEKNNNCIQKYR